MSKTKKMLTVFSLAMINVAAVGSVKNLPLSAEYGFSAVFYYLLATVIFFIPVALVSAELATGWPQIGGIFVWVKEAFGHRLGFLAIWLLWIENVIWYPTALTFITATIAYIFYPPLMENIPFLITTNLILFWLATFANTLGMRISSLISTWGVLLGAFIPVAVIIALGGYWIASGRPLEIAFTMESFIPNMGSLDNIVLFSGIILSLAGLEMSAIHARDVKNPQKDYPKAILLSGILILAMILLGVLAIAIVIPKGQISLVAGALQAFAFFFNAFGMEKLMPVMAALIAIGAAGSMSTWIIGPSRGLLAAAQSGDLPPIFRKVNKHNMPKNLLVLQAIIVSLLSLIFALVPTINTAYWILIVLVAQLYVVMFVLMFAAAIKLRYSHAKVKRAYRVPFGNLGMWVVCLVGMATSLFSLAIGFFPPAEVQVASKGGYILTIAIGVIFFCSIPSIILLFKKPHWSKALEHEKK